MGLASTAIISASKPSFTSPRSVRPSISALLVVAVLIASLVLMPQSINAANSMAFLP